MLAQAGSLEPRMIIMSVDKARRQQYTIEVSKEFTVESVKMDISLDGYYTVSL